MLDHEIFINIESILQYKSSMFPWHHVTWQEVEFNPYNISAEFQVF